jgi:mRNA-degrading endonuclease YafQ of YafQ-DinJ toxin-antitoxin module
MTLMTNDLNDHHDCMVVVEVFLVYDKKKQSLMLSRVPGFSNNLNPRYNPLTSFAKHIT